MLSLFVGIAMFASRLVKPLASVVGLPASRFGGSAGRLARENAVRNPGRTASTAAALMIGLALVTVVAMLGAGLQGSTESAAKKQIDADYVVTAKEGGGAFPAASDAALARRGARPSRPCARTPRKVAGDESPVSGIDAKTIGEFYKFDWTSGSLAGLDDGGAIVSKGFAEGHDLKVGSTFTVQSSSGQTLKPRVVGIHEPPKMDSLLGDVAVSQKAFDGAFARPQNLFTFVDGSSKAALAQGDGRLPGRQGHDLGGVRHEPRRRPEDDPQDALRPARLLRGREPLRHGQHARARRLRAHA